MKIEEIASAIRNNVISGLKGSTSNLSFSLDQIEEEIILERLALIKQYHKEGLININDLFQSINCQPVDCKKISKNPNGADPIDIQQLSYHVEIPQIVMNNGIEAIRYFGSVDKAKNFKVYTTNAWKHHRYSRWLKNRPYIWIDISPNENNMLDAFIFNSPYLQRISLMAIFKDPRQLYSVSDVYDDYDDLTFFQRDIINRLTEKYLRVYRQGALPNTPNDQQKKP